MGFEKSLFLEKLTGGLRQLQIEVPGDSLYQMAEFAQLIVSKNRTLNLTRLVEPDEMAVKNFVDSLTVLLKEWPQEQLCLDVGTGAGFPGMPLAMARAGWRWVLLDSTRKRLNFIAEASASLGLANVAIYHARAEDAGRDRGHRELYDLVLSRAVAALPVLLELCAPFVKLGGAFVAYKGSDAEAELAESRAAQLEFNLILEEVIPLELPLAMRQRSLLIFRKTKPVPRIYPRRAGMAQKRPVL